MKAKNISRYTYKKTAFQGWRLSIMRNGAQFTEYFSDKQYNNDHKESFRAAKTVRDEILGALKKCRDEAKKCKVKAEHKLAEIVSDYRERRAKAKAEAASETKQ